MNPRVDKSSSNTFACGSFAATCPFLSSRAGAFVTGAAITLDGGYVVSANLLLLAALYRIMILGLENNAIEMRYGQPCVEKLVFG